MKNLVFITYDSVRNSVFESQVLAPLLKTKKHNPELEVVLVSFEPTQLASTEIEKIEQTGIRFHTYQRWPFIYKEFLWPEIRFLKKILAPLKNCILKARGPIAGYIAIKSAKLNCEKLIIQARGLLAEEYDYVYRHEKHLLKKLLHKLRKHFYEDIEKTAYGALESFDFAADYAKASTARQDEQIKSARPKLIEGFERTLEIESVSQPLKDYLVTHFHADPSRITIAQDDIPEPIDPALKQQWRQEIRQELGIPESTQVYVYCGSAHPWQCPEEMMIFFKQKLNSSHPSIFFLILSRDQEAFKSLLAKYQIPAANYRLLKAKQTDIFKYLSAADCALLFRENHIINHVARPTKMLEYRACGLGIIKH